MMVVVYRWDCGIVEYSDGMVVVVVVASPSGIPELSDPVSIIY